MFEFLSDDLFDVIVLLLIPGTLAVVQLLTISLVITYSWFVSVHLTSGHFINAIVKNLLSLENDLNIDENERK